MTYEVIKPLPAKGVVLQPGEQVDASEWRNLDVLVSQRYLKPIRPNGRDKRMGRKESDANTGN